ncbi:MAG: F0F1 ATP synthase subunit A [Bacteroides sp.]|nr:F0F1 ATP synthase subunit A [Bacteroides sp.]
MKNKRYLLAIIFLLAVAGWAHIQAAGKSDSDEISIKEIIFSHIGDAYDWHIATIGEKHISIPLPVIVYSKATGWHVFSSGIFHHHPEYEGFFIAEEGNYQGKIVERRGNGEVLRPIDISLTKNAFSLIINGILLVVIILGVARWYKGKSPDSPAPKGFVGFMEMFIMMVHDDVIKSCIGKDYKRYTPYLLTAFFFIFFNNVMGLIPLFPGGTNLTGNIAVTFVLALCTFLAVNLFGTKEYWKEILWPDVPIWLKVPIPLMPVIEIFGIFTKPFALMIRLFANIMAGHSAVIGLTCIIFITVSLGPVMNGAMMGVSVFFGIFMNCLELLVAFIQAYIFTMLSAVFISLSRVAPHHH